MQLLYQQLSKAKNLLVLCHSSSWGITLICYLSFTLIFCCRQLSYGLYILITMILYSDNMGTRAKTLLTVLTLIALVAVIATAANSNIGVLGWGESSACNTVSGVTICAYAYAYVEPYGDYGYVYGKVYSNPYEMLCLTMYFWFTSVDGRRTPTIQHYELKYGFADEDYWLPASQLGGHIERANILVQGKLTDSYLFCPPIYPDVSTSTWATNDY